MATSARAPPSAAVISHSEKVSLQQSGEVAADSNSDEDATPPVSVNERERLGSESSSRASKKNNNALGHPHKAGSATSKSSGGGRPRQDSLKRAKEIAESATATTPKRGVQAARSAHSKTIDAFLPPKDRQGSIFRVGEVGGGGRIYLRPVTNSISTSQSSPVQSPSRSKPKPFVTRPGEVAWEDQEEGEKNKNKQPKKTREGEDGEDGNGEAANGKADGKDDKDEDDEDEDGDTMSDSVANDGKGVPTDFTGHESAWTRLSTTQDVHGAPSDIFRHRPRSRRSMSESTASHAPGRAAALAQTKAVKVVIDRPDSDPASLRHQSGLGHSFDGLDISIPNYSMGSPRFTDQGTPFLQSAAYTASAQPLAAVPPAAQFLERIPDGAPAPSPLGPSPLQRQLPSRRHSQASPYTQSIASFSYDSVLLPNTIETHIEPRRPLAREVITPAVYDDLATAPNDRSVVRYSPTSGEMVAATPARLIVQITAETFLDYELLSDFFLTVRSYLSIHDLQSLLLARFEWAVNRFDDNGRIIRVRSFAAIRHWILNYFAYDFVPNRRLRVQFCRKLNQLFKLVQSRNESGLPDLKLISDLKKCWNGRLVLYWDRPVDNSLEADLMPGGPGPGEGEEDDDYDDAALGSVTAASTDGVYSTPGSPPANYHAGGDRDEEEADNRPRSRATSGTTTRSTPLSPGSETSAREQQQRKDHSGKQSTRSVRSGRRSPPDYRQSGASSDFIGGGSQASYEQQHQQPPAQPLQTSAYRSVLRGHLLAPASPFVTTAPITPGLQLNSPTLSPAVADTTPNRRNMNSGISSTGPGVKQFMHNIKRALSSKVSSGSGLPLDHAILLDSSSTANSLQQRPDGSTRIGQQSADASKTTLASLKSGQMAVENVRAAMRIDILAEQISYEFQRAMQGDYRQPVRYDDPRLLQQQQQHRQTNGSTISRRGVSMLAPAVAKQLPSGMTSSSQSIVIFDDTGDAPSRRMMQAAASNGNTPRISVKQPSAGQGALTSSRPELHAGAAPSHLAAGNFEVSAQEVGSNATSSAATPARLSIVGVHQHHQRQPSQGSMSLRRVASYQSALNRPLIETSTGDFIAAVPDPSRKEDTMIPASAVPARGLRRVPGGDLRANQNITDLEGQMPRPKSTGSIATFASTRESEILSFGARITKTFKRDRTDRPLISPAITDTFPSPLKNEADRDTITTEKKVSYIRSQSDDKTGRRASFDDLVRTFADMPDDDEGGPEEALAKLEGRYIESSAARSKASKGNAKKSAAEMRKPSTSSADTLHAKQTARSTLESTEYARSEDSYNSTPLLEREPTTASPRAKGKASSVRSGSNSQRSNTDSFLLDDSQDGSDSDDFSDDSRLPSDMNAYSNQNPSSPQTNGRSQYNPTDMSPNRNFVERHIGQTGGPTSQTHPAVHVPLASGPRPRHMPFVLGHDSRVLCEQLTLIEKDALREIDWRDLVDMRWQHTASSITNWVSYLMSTTPLGIDLVTARFNIMVKWVLSEIVLTESIEERAHTIIKFIHIAREARRTCNYATLLQFTIALTSNDCARMRKTWALVPQAEKDTLKDLEALVSPRRNFASLRSEMEDAPAEQGCIPVLALYIHDLTYNAQKPGIVEYSLGTDRDGQKLDSCMLINFERYRNTAVIVKNLLRLIDASGRYNYVPVDDVLSHCMWISCLPDDLITAKSRQLEGVTLGPTVARNHLRY